MTNDKTVTMSQRLAELCAQCLTNSGYVMAHDELRAILAAPVIERQPVDAILLSDCVPGWHSDYNDGLFATDDAVQKLYTSPPELAELQSTIAQLQARLQGLESSQVMGAYTPH